MVTPETETTSSHPQATPEYVPAFAPHTSTAILAAATALPVVDGGYGSPGVALSGHPGFNS
jgi:hypothetical protein